VRIFYQQEFKTEQEAKLIENEIKKWFKKQKQFLINNDWSEISKLAKKFI
jgi:predicted GIY-YIG superfamily endonuclease